MKKTIRTILAILLVLTLIPFAAAAEELVDPAEIAIPRVGGEDLDADLPADPEPMEEMTPAEDPQAQEATNDPEQAAAEPEQTTAEPAASTGLPSSMTWEGLSTSIRPSCFISNTPISLVDPKRFFTPRRMRYAAFLSPSK